MTWPNNKEDNKGNREQIKKMKIKNLQEKGGNKSVYRRNLWVLQEFRSKQREENR